MTSADNGLTFNTGLKSLDVELKRLSEIVAREDLDTFPDRDIDDLGEIFSPRTIALAVSIATDSGLEKLFEAANDSERPAIEKLAEQVRSRLKHFLDSTRAQDLVDAIPDQYTQANYDPMFPNVVSVAGTSVLTGDNMQPRILLRAFDKENEEFINACLKWDDVFFITHIALEKISSDVQRFSSSSMETGVNVEQVGQWLEETEKSLAEFRALWDIWRETKS